MTTFTKINDDETPTISVHPSRPLSKINPKIYSGFTEYDLRRAANMWITDSQPGTWEDAFMAESMIPETLSQIPMASERTS
jgi:hypothetical protein